MYKIFVVEDEPVIRQNIRNAIDRTDGPYMFCGEASDGEMALSMMLDLQPDILLTDIKMPFMDGLELSRHAKAMMPWLKILILSGHDEFEFAREAISIGVDQYLLKPIAQKDLKAAFDGVVRQIEEEKSTRSLSQKYDEQAVQHALYQQLMNHLLYGGRSTAQLLEDAQPLGLHLIHNFYQVVLFQFTAPNCPLNPSIFNEKMNLLDADLPAFLHFNGRDLLTAIVYDSDQNTINEKAYQTIKAVQHAFQDTDWNITTTVGNIVDRLSAVKDAFSAADTQARKLYDPGTDEIIDLNDWEPASACVLPYSDAFGTSYEQKLHYASTEDIPALLEEFYSHLEPGQLSSLLYRYYILMDILNTSVRVVQAANPQSDPRDVASRFGNLHDIFLASGTRETFDQKALELLQQAVSMRQSEIQGAKGENVIAKAAAFIRENFSNPDISLHLAAKHVGFSPAHFSMVFSQKMGRTFIDYLTHLRIEKAKELLSNTDKKLAAIALEIGYNEPNYFSYVFKKHEGMTPKEFRLRAQGT